MNNIITKKQIKNNSRDFRTVANRVLNSDFDAFDDNLKRLMNHINNNIIIKEYIDSCTQNDDIFDIKEEVEQVSGGYGQYIFESFIDERKELVYTYQLLTYITENNIKFRGYTYPYSSSNKYQDKVKGFNDKVVLPFVNSIDGNYERICVEMGLDETTPFNITINGGQVNIAKDDATINATQNIYSEIDELVNQVKNNIETIDNSDLRNEIIDNIEGLQEELKKNNPKKGIINSIVSSLKLILPKIKSATELFAAITQIIAFVTTK